MAAFDGREDVNRSCWLATRKINVPNVKEQPPLTVLVMASTWYRAKEAACVYLQVEPPPGPQMEMVDAKGKAPLSEGTVVIVAGKDGGLETFETTGATNCDRICRGEDLRLREPVARQKRREDARVVHRMQKNR